MRVRIAKTPSNIRKLSDLGFIKAHNNTVKEYRFIRVCLTTLRYIYTNTVGIEQPLVREDLIPALMMLPTKEACIAYLYVEGAIDIRMYRALDRKGADACIL